MAFTFFLKLVASKIDLNFFKALAAPKPILTLDASNKVTSSLKSCFRSLKKSEGLSYKGLSA